MSIASINSLQIVFPGQTTCTPRIGHLYAPSNTLAEVTAAGFLNPYIKQAAISLLPTDAILACASDGTQWYKCVFAAGTRILTLTALP
jgi:hypothetical protein